MKFEKFPKDVREAAIHAYMLSASKEETPLDENGAKLQKVRLELLASNIHAGFAKLIIC